MKNVCVTLIVAIASMAMFSIACSDDNDVCTYEGRGPGKFAVFVVDGEKVDSAFFANSFAFCEETGDTLKFSALSADTVKVVLPEPSSCPACLTVIAKSDTSVTYGREYNTRINLCGGEFDLRVSFQKEICDYYKNFYADVYWFVAEANLLGAEYLPPAYSSWFDSMLFHIRRTSNGWELIRD